MPAVVPFIPLIAAGVTGGAEYAAARSASKATTRAADTQAQAAREAGEREEQARKEAEAWARQQKQQEWVEAEANRRANYDQWASRQRSMNEFRKKYGYGEMAIPDYVPSQNPNFVPPPVDQPPPPPQQDYTYIGQGADPRGSPLSSVLPGEHDPNGRYTPPAPESRRATPARPRRDLLPMGSIGSFLPVQPGYQSYAMPSSGSIDDYLLPRRTRR